MTLLAWSLNLAYMALIFWLSHQPKWVVEVPEFFGVDKLLHVGCYFWLGVLWAWCLWTTGLRRRPLFLAAWLAASLYGVTDEFHQSFVPNRGVEVLDGIADSLGAALGALCFPWILGRTKRG